jgi:predicted RNase H-like HicB family nuclease
MELPLELLRFTGLDVLELRRQRTNPGPPAAPVPRELPGAALPRAAVSPRAAPPLGGSVRAVRLDNDIRARQRIGRNLLWRLPSDAGMNEQPYQTVGSERGGLRYWTAQDALIAFSARYGRRILAGSQHRLGRVVIVKGARHLRHEVGGRGEVSASDRDGEIATDLIARIFGHCPYGLASDGRCPCALRTFDSAMLLVDQALRAAHLAVAVERNTIRTAASPRLGAATPDRAHLVRQPTSTTEVQSYCPTAPIVRRSRPTGGESLRMADALTYAVILEPDPSDLGFNVHIPAFPRVHTQGEDVEDALRNAREAIELEIKVMLERGETLPRSDGDADIRIERVAVTPPPPNLRPPGEYPGRAEQNPEQQRWL